MVTILKMRRIICLLRLSLPTDMQNISNCGVISGSLSDHEMVYYVRKLNWYYVHYDPKKFNNELRSINLSPVNIPDVDMCN